MTAEKEAADQGRPPPRVADGFARVRQVPVSQPSPVVTFTTARVRRTSWPERRGSVLVDIPRQTLFWMLKTTPFSPWHVRDVNRVNPAVNVAATSDVCARWMCEAAAMLVRTSAASAELSTRSFVRFDKCYLPARFWQGRSQDDMKPLGASGKDSVRERLARLGFAEESAEILAEHFLDAEARGKRGHGLARVDWLETLPDLDPAARPERIVAEPGYERWDGRGALGYLTLAAVCTAQLADPPATARVVVASHCFPTGMLGHWVRKLVDGGLVAVLTATSPPRLAHPDGGPPLAGTNPLAIGVPSSDGKPLVADVSMGRVTYGHVLAGAAEAEELVPFGGDRAHKAFALAVGLHTLVDALAGEGYGAVLVVARPETDPVPGLRARAAGVRLPGDG